MTSTAYAKALREQRADSEWTGGPMDWGHPATRKPHGAEGTYHGPTYQQICSKFKRPVYSVGLHKNDVSKFKDPEDRRRFEYSCKVFKDGADVSGTISNCTMMLPKDRAIHAGIEAAKNLQEKSDYNVEGRAIKKWFEEQDKLANWH